jgi:hypothetical protein
LKYRDGNAKNQSAAMKRIAVILFSLVLVYGSVGWALGKCLSHDRQHEHSIEAHNSHSHGSTSLDDSRGSFLPVIHCPPAEMRIGPAVQSDSTQLRLYKVSTIRASSFHKPASLTLGRRLWLEAVFRRTPASLYPDDLARHLFISILQI